MHTVTSHSQFCVCKSQTVVVARATWTVDIGLDSSVVEHLSSWVRFPVQPYIFVYVFPTRLSDLCLISSDMVLNTHSCLLHQMGEMGDSEPEILFFLPNFHGKGAGPPSYKNHQVSLTKRS